MARPATKIEDIRAELVDPSVRKHDLWLYSVRKDLEREYARGALAAPEYHDLLGVVFGHEGDLDAAVAHGRRAVEMAPRNGSICFNLAVSLTSAEQFEEARTILEQLQEDGFPTVKVRAALVSVYSALGEWRHARTALADAAAIADLDNIEHLWRLSRAAAAAGKYTMAVEMFAYYLAARAGEGRERVTSDPLAYVLRVLEQRSALNDVPTVPEPVIDAIRRTGLVSGVVTPTRPPKVSSADDAADADAVAVLDEWTATRHRATKAVLTDDE